VNVIHTKMRWRFPDQTPTQPEVSHMYFFQSLAHSYTLACVDTEAYPYPNIQNSLPWSAKLLSTDIATSQGLNWAKMGQLLERKQAAI